MPSGPIDTDKPPSPWTVTSDFCKTVVTLASALLGLTVTFASQLIGNAGATTQFFLFTSWFFMAATVLLGIVSHGFIINFLKKNQNEHASVLLANIAFYSLLASTVSFAIFGGCAVRDQSPLGATGVAAIAVREAGPLSGQASATWKLTQLEWNETAGQYEVELIDPSAPQDKYTMSLDGDGEVKSFATP